MHNFAVVIQKMNHLSLLEEVLNVKLLLKMDFYQKCSANLSIVKNWAGLFVMVKMMLKVLMVLGKSFKLENFLKYRFYLSEEY